MSECLGLRDCTFQGLTLLATVLLSRLQQPKRQESKMPFYPNVPPSLWIWLAPPLEACDLIRLSRLFPSLGGAL